MRLAHLRERSCMRRDSNMGGLGAKQACAQFKNGSRVFLACVSVARMFVARALPVKCDSVAHIKRLHV